MQELNELESAVLDKILEGDGPALKTLREQKRLLLVRSREYSGVGFFTEFALPPNAPKVSMLRPIRFGDVIATIEGMEHGAGFVLFIDNGWITMLEGYDNAGEKWPYNVSSFQLSYWALRGFEWVS